MKKIVKYILIYLISVISMFGILVISALMPTKNIKKHIEESANYFYECNNDFPCVINGNSSTMLDHYSDSILLGIAYNINNKHPFMSIIKAEYYRDNSQFGCFNLYNQVINKVDNNTTYERYWHGSLIWLRFLLIFTNIKGVYIINGIVMILLLAYLLFLLIKKHAYGLGVALILGGLVTYSFLAPKALEFTWTYLVMLITSIAVVIALDKKRDSHIIPIFIIAGALINFTDFLTAETMVLTVPLIIVAYFKKSELKITYYLKCMAAWLLSYSAMWFTKWCIAAIAMKESIKTIAYNSIVLRTVGNEETLDTSELLKSSFIRNIKALFPLNKEMAGVFAIVILVIVAIYLSIVFQKKKVDTKYILTMLIIGLIPYIRFFVMSEHSAGHYFHTYRAQIASAMVPVLIVLEMVNWDLFKSKKKHKKK